METVRELKQVKDEAHGLLNVEQKLILRVFAIPILTASGL